MFHPATHLMALEYLTVYTGVLSKGEMNIIHLTYCRRSPWSFSKYHEKSKLIKFGPPLPNLSFCGNRAIHLMFFTFTDSFFVDSVVIKICVRIIFAPEHY
jgi:hypothetical protein